MNTVIQISLQDHSFNSFGYAPRSRIAGSLVILILILQSTAILFSIVAYHLINTVPPTVHKCSNFSTLSSTLVIFHLYVCEVRNFNLHLCNDSLEKTLMLGKIEGRMRRG